MPNGKETSIGRPEAKDRKAFIRRTGDTIINMFNPKDQNIIVKELYFIVWGNRMRRIAEQREKKDYLNKLNEDFSVKGEE